MKKIGITFMLSLVGLFLLIPVTHAQAVYAAKQNFRAQVGAGYLYLRNDYTTQPAEGISIWGDVDFVSVKGILIGGEIEANFGGLETPGDIAETTYLAGPRFSVHKRKLNIYGKVLFGHGRITNQDNYVSSSYNIFPAFGGGVEYRITRRINLRPIGIELQKWPSFQPNPLSPIAFTFGASYTIR